MADNTDGDKSNAGARDSGSKSIILKVVGNDLNDLLFRVNRTSKLGKLKKIYSEHVGSDVTSLRFLFDGTRINDEDTPMQLGMENKDIIEVYKEQTGGRCYNSEK